MVANCRPGKAQWWPNVGQVWPNIGQMVAKCGLSEPQFEPEGVDSVQVVSEEAFVTDETEVFVQPQRRPVRDFSLQNHLQKEQTIKAKLRNCTRIKCRLTKNFQISDKNTNKRESLLTFVNYPLMGDITNHGI